MATNFAFTIESALRKNEYTNVRDYCKS